MFHSSEDEKIRSGSNYFLNHSKEISQYYYNCSLGKLKAKAVRSVLPKEAHHSLDSQEYDSDILSETEMEMMNKRAEQAAEVKKNRLKRFQESSKARSARKTLR